MKIKKLVLATGEEFNDATIIGELSEDEEKWLPSTMLKVEVDSKKIMINRDYILSIELDSNLKVIEMEEKSSVFDESVAKIADGLHMSINEAEEFLNNVIRIVKKEL